jgi:ABC-type bacteriocin/lantibiotic exporter with double-glycine peptidase domain
MRLITATKAGDDATACLAMILHHYGRHPSLDEVRRAIYAESDSRASALSVIEGAARFGLRGRGLSIGDVSNLGGLRPPYIAHIRSHGGAFAVIAKASGRQVTVLDPHGKQSQMTMEQFAQAASGVFLVFERAMTVPPK